MDLSKRMIAVIGLGYVGLPLAVEFGKKRSVIGFDIKVNRIEELQAGQDHTREVSEESLRAATHLTFSSDPLALRGDSSLHSHAEGVGAGANEPIIFIVTVPTPVDKTNRPDLGPLIRASKTVGKLLKPKDVVIYESTVYPGATEEVCVPVLQKESGLNYVTGDSNEPSVLESGFFVGYSPERINPGDKTHRLPTIKKVTSGSTAEAAQAINALYQEIVTAGTHLASSIKVAEAAKVIENAQRDLNIAFVNELSMIFNCMSIDTAEVLRAAATKWNFIPFQPGLVGGHCIGVDPYYLTYKARELGYEPEVILAGRRVNENMSRHAARNTIRLMRNSGIDVAKATVGVLGITFKENCPDVRNSRVIDMIHELREHGVRVKVNDPWANANEVHQTYDLVLEEISPSNPVDSLIVAVAHTEFMQMTPSDLRRLCSKNDTPVIADLKGLYGRRDLEAQQFQVFQF